MRTMTIIFFLSLVTSLVSCKQGNETEQRSSTVRLSDDEKTSISSSSEKEAEWRRLFFSYSGSRGSTKTFLGSQIVSSNEIVDEDYSLEEQQGYDYKFALLNEDYDILYTKESIPNVFSKSF
ncbi:MAG: hypothetical protein OXB84_03390, partial [Halobacteriovoraceae bacterium]|nr:hypothetical protein [Halobacteriovoraceae bacterium]